MSLFLDTTSKSSFTQRADAATPRTAQAAVESDDAAPDVKQTIGAALKKAGEAASTFGGTLTARFDEARKNSAREQIAQVQQRIQMLKRMILLFGGSKALLRELKQLSRHTCHSGQDVKGRRQQHEHGDIHLQRNRCPTQPARHANRGSCPKRHLHAGEQ